MSPQVRDRGFKMKKLALTAISLLIAGSASAADLRRPMPVKGPAPAPVAVGYNWTGCYIGAGGGYGMFNQEVQFVDGTTPIGLSNDVGGRGWFGTVQVGCDYQIGSNIVIGAFGDYDFASIKGDWTNGILTGLVGEEKLKSSWAAGGRIGWIPFQASQLLVYVAGGYAEARFNAINLVAAIDGSPTPLSVDKHTYSGWFLGTGYEYGLSWFPVQGLFWKTEYRFADYGTDRVRLLSAGFDTGDGFDQRKYVQTIRSELVWRFNFGGPVVARY
jgi:outer membrane immunogenic protein